jgi:PAS domain S-box-containing protein
MIDPTEDPTVAESPLLPVSEEATFLRLFEAAAVALALTDDARRITRINRAFTDLLGYTPERALSMRLDDLVAPGTQSLALPAWDVRSGGNRAARVSVLRADRSTIEVRYGALSSVIKGAHLVVLAASKPGRATNHAADRRHGGRLTRREQESLRLVARGMTTTVAAQQLGISPETVRTHVRNAMNKLGARTRAQAIAVALRDGEIADQP